MASRSGQVMLSWPSSLQGHSDFPMPLTAPYGFHTACVLLTTAGIQWEHWDLRSNTRTLSPHATGLTPGSPQVQMPFASLRTMAFSINVEDRRISCLNAGLSRIRTLPAIPVLTELTRLHHSLYAAACGFGRHP